jgi:putative hemolysin
MMDTKKPIDVKEVLQQKAPNLAKKIPGFLVNYLIRTIHQEMINEIIDRYHELDGIDFMQALVDEFDLTLEVNGEQWIPTDGRQFIFASNHPLGGLDGVCIAAVMGQYFGSKISCPVNDLLLFIPNLRSIFVPVNKHGSQGRLVAQKVEEAFASDKQILTFPAGLCSRMQKGKICDLEWKKSFILKAVEYRRDVVPVYFEGRNSNFFYRLANFRKRFGIKMNIEMLYLPDEMFKQRHSLFRLYFGQPVPWQTFDSSKKPAEWAEWVKQRVYSLNDKQV